METRNGALEDVDFFLVGLNFVGPKSQHLELGTAVWTAPHSHAVPPPPPHDAHWPHDGAGAFCGPWWKIEIPKKQNNIKVASSQFGKILERSGQNHHKHQFSTIDWIDFFHNKKPKITPHQALKKIPVPPLLLPSPNPDEAVPQLSRFPLSNIQVVTGNWWQLQIAIHSARTVDGSEIPKNQPPGMM